MEQKNIISLCVGICLMFALWLLGPKTVISTGVPTVVPTVIIQKEPTLSPSQIIWLARLMNCESGLNEASINPKDLDNTPSWGLLQFKPETFATFTAKYGIPGTLMNAEAQTSIVIHWILYPGEVDWTRQFPGCVAKYGLPPLI